MEASTTLAVQNPEFPRAVGEAWPFDSPLMSVPFSFSPLISNSLPLCSFLPSSSLDSPFFDSSLIGVFLSGVVPFASKRFASLFLGSSNPFFSEMSTVGVFLPEVLPFRSSLIGVRLPVELSEPLRPRPTKSPTLHSLGGVTRLRRTMILSPERTSGLIDPSDITSGVRGSTAASSVCSFLVLKQFLHSVLRQVCGSNLEHCTFLVCELIVRLPLIGYGETSVSLRFPTLKCLSRKILRNLSQ